MADINILHFSDLHEGASGQDFLWGNVERVLFSDLEKVTKYVGKWDLLFITGDLVFSGKDSEYTELNNKLKRIYKKLNDLDSNPALVTVPGNHDLFRPDKTEPIVEVIKDWAEKPYLHKDFWENSKNEYRQFLNSLFVNYNKWLNTHPFPRLSSYKFGLLPGDFSATYTNKGLSVGLSGLNTSFFHILDDSYKKLYVHPLQLQTSVGKYQEDWLNAHHLTLLLSHHPPEWLSPAGLNYFDGEIALPGRFSFCFSGHLHENLQRSESINGATTKHRFQSASAFGLKNYGRENEERIHGYCAFKFSVEANVANVKYWPRVGTRDKSKQIQITPDTAFSLKEDRFVEIDQISAKTDLGCINQEKQQYTVLLLSNSGDLTRYSDDAAAYLQSSLGIGVVQKDEKAEIDPSGSDLTILLLGWQWNDGMLPKAWMQARTDKRFLLFPDENSDWPPKRLVEKGKEANIEKFIENNSCIYFLSPDDLPEKIGEIVVEHMGRTLDDHAIGLLGIERAYLSYRLPSWLAGRSSTNNSHLFNCEDAEDLYQPDLYVQLDAFSKNYTLDDKLQLKCADKSTTIGENDTFTRGQIGYWISFPEFKRVGIVGAPGGGKTIFLTRLAADLANACLGRRVDLASGIDRVKFRNCAGVTPIPILIEATKLAKVIEFGIKGILSVLNEELAVTGQNIDVEVLCEGLKAGKYALLVDALDEISNFQIRKNVLLNLKGFCGSDCYPEVRLIITTRSARYTGSLAFGPEFELLEVAPMDETQVHDLCTKWTVHRKRDEKYKDELLSAVSGLREEYITDGGGSLVEIPLMLTAVCMVVDRYKALPDDRGRLCELLIEDLCRSRRSEDVATGWKLDDAQKKDNLQRIALNMQIEGAQDWNIEKAEEIIFNGVPVNDPNRTDKARKFLVWTAEHTGLLRFNAEDTGEKIRFWHRVFREYLAASRLSQMDITVTEQVQQIWKDGILSNPFWEDVVRMLPRAYGTREKATSLIRELERLASENNDARGRLLGLSTAAIVESRDLFPEIDENEKAEVLAETFISEGKCWPVRDRIFFLKGLGRLSRNFHDPRIKEFSWLKVPKSSFIVPRKENTTKGPKSSKKVHQRWKENNTQTIQNLPYEIMQYPITIQDYVKFIESPEITDAKIWRDTPAELVDKVLGIRPGGWEMQLRQPNEPVAGISMYEVLAYCRWLTQKNDDGFIYVLPTIEQLLGAAYDVDTKMNLHDIRIALKCRNTLSELLSELSDFIKVPVGSIRLDDVGIKSQFDQYSIRFEWAKGGDTGLIENLRVASTAFARFTGKSVNKAPIVFMRDDLHANHIGYNITASSMLSVVGFRCVRRKVK